MEEEQRAEKKEPPRGGSRRSTRTRYAPDLKLKAVRLVLEDGFSRYLVSREIGVCQASLDRWLEHYRTEGEAGLKDPRATPAAGKDKLPAAITTKIVALKREHPSFGVKRIAQVLRRLFWLPASAETVRQRLHREGLLPPSAPPRPRNLTRPRFFERATPNQMWQSDIFTFRLGGRYAYLIGFLDDYSRFVVGADLFRSPTAAAVIEVYRVAVGEYQPPKEMLTDNGRQYTTWRGTSRFEAELQKDRVRHFKSQPHHPMTLGKIERFWESIWGEFLARAQFESFDAARERIKLWIKYYNHRRPHQGIGGLCPADRFFEIQTELKKTLEAGIQDNLLELALRGQPRAPFYLVGRMEGQSVVLHAEKGKLKLAVTNPENQTRELEYDLHPQNPDSREDAGPAPTPGSQTPDQCARQSASGSGGLDRPLQALRGLSPVADQLDHLQPLADPGDGGHAPGPGKPGEPGPGGGLEPAPASTPPEAAAGGQREQAQQSARAGPEGCIPGAGGQTGVDELPELGSPVGDPHPAGPGRAVDGDGGRAPDGGLAQDVLSMGAPGAPGPDAGTAPGPAGPTAGGSLARDPAPAGADPNAGAAAGEDRAGGPAARTPGPSQATPVPD